MEVVGLTWGDYNEDLFRFDNGSVDFIVGSDLFFDPEVFEPLIETVAYLLDQNSNAQVFSGIYAQNVSKLIPLSVSRFYLLSVVRQLRISG